MNNNKESTINKKRMKYIESKGNIDDSYENSCVSDRGNVNDSNENPCDSGSGNVESASELSSSPKTVKPSEIINDGLAETNEKIAKKPTEKIGILGLDSTESDSEKIE